jgi:hypothetical protein
MSAQSVGAAIDAPPNAPNTLRRHNHALFFSNNDYHYYEEH